MLNTFFFFVSKHWSLCFEALQWLIYLTMTEEQGVPEISAWLRWN